MVTLGQVKKWEDPCSRDTWTTLKLVSAETGSFRPDQNFVPKFIASKCSPSQPPAKNGDKPHPGQASDPCSPPFHTSAGIITRLGPLTPPLSAPQTSPTSSREMTTPKGMELMIPQPYPSTLMQAHTTNLPFSTQNHPQSWRPLPHRAK